MIGHKFYYGTTRKVIIAFGALFSDIQIDREDSIGVFQTIDVPLSYTQKEKFIRIVHEVTPLVGEEVTVKETLPRMGFELTSIVYDQVRKTNTMHKLRKPQKTSEYMYNRVPYNFTMSLYIGTRKFDDSLRIIEQIIPFFTPEFTVRVVDKEDFGIETNIPFTLDAVDFEINDETDMHDERRSVFWTLQFTAKTYVYAPVNTQSIIKKSIIDISSQNTGDFYEQYMAAVNPITANEEDPHTIVETISDEPRDSQVVNVESGQEMHIDSLT